MGEAGAWGRGHPQEKGWESELQGKALSSQDPSRHTTEHRGTGL